MLEEKRIFIGKSFVKTLALEDKAWGWLASWHRNGFDIAGFLRRCISYGDEDIKENYGVSAAVNDAVYMIATKGPGYERWESFLLKTENPPPYLECSFFNPGHGDKPH